MTVPKSSNNVFEQLGFEEPELHATKAFLMMLIERLMKQKKLSTDKAAQIIGVSEDKLSLLQRGQFQGISTDILLRGFYNLGGSLNLSCTADGKTFATTLSNNG